MERPRIDLNADSVWFSDPSNSGVESYLHPFGVVVESDINADGSVRVALVFDCDLVINEGAEPNIISGQVR